MADTATTATHSLAYGNADSGIGRGFRAALRIGAALLFIQHGGQKLLGWFGGIDGEGGTAELFSQMGLAGAIELVGGLLLLIGLFTVPVALIAALEMVAAYVLAHMPQGGFPIENQGELALLYMLVWAYIAAAGPGALSVDGAMARRTTSAGTVTDTSGPATTSTGSGTTRPGTTGPGTSGPGSTGPGTGPSTTEPADRDVR